MKIRHKQTWKVVEGVYHDADKRRYTGVWEDQISHFPIMYWEPVTKEEWEDVTEGCVVSQIQENTIGILHNGVDITRCGEGYRLRKVVHYGILGAEHSLHVDRRRPT